jgi:hypothetical protein
MKLMRDADTQIWPPNYSPHTHTSCTERKTTRPTANNENKNIEIKGCLKHVRHHPVGQAARVIQIMN